MCTVQLGAIMLQNTPEKFARTYLCVGAIAGRSRAERLYCSTLSHSISQQRHPNFKVLNWCNGLPDTVCIFISSFLYEFSWAGTEAQCSCLPRSEIWESLGNYRLVFNVFSWQSSCGNSVAQRCQYSFLLSWRNEVETASLGYAQSLHADKGSSTRSSL